MVDQWSRLTLSRETKVSGHPGEMGEGTLNDLLSSFPSGYWHVCGNLSQQWKVIGHTQKYMGEWSEHLNVCVQLNLLDLWPWKVLETYGVCGAQNTCPSGSWSSLPADGLSWSWSPLFYQLSDASPLPGFPYTDSLLHRLPVPAHWVPLQLPLCWSVQSLGLRQVCS